MVAAPCETGGERPPARHAPQERHDAVGSGERAVEVEGGDDGWRHAASPSSMLQNAGQLFDTTSRVGDLDAGDHRADHAERHRQPVVVVGRQPGRRADRDAEGCTTSPSSVSSIEAAERPQLAGEIAEPVALLAADEADTA